jgi:serine/threonine protein kinase/tetratricopeptide (TPR) repeat protein
METSSGFKPGLQISHYRIVELIGTGGMAEVYLADDLDLRRKVALKLLRCDSDTAGDAKSIFQIEAQTAASLNHPNIVTIYEILDYQGWPVISMEYVKGRLLSKLIKESDLSVNRTLDLALQLCAGISAAHKLGIIHRDIKSDNIMVAPDDQIKIMDFGLAFCKNNVLTRGAGSIAGTYSYMSPEQARGEKVDARTDLFSSGVVLYEMLTGLLPFGTEVAAAIAYSIINENPEPLEKYRPGIHHGFQKIIDRALKKDLTSRYQEADEMIVDLKILRDSIDKNSSKMDALVAKTRPSIAVLPFRDMSPQKNQEYFGEGIAEDIINNLTRMRGMRVVARTSSFGFKDISCDIKEIGEKLGVQSILEGSVRYVDNRIRITAQLIDVESGYHVWSERYDRVMKDMFEIQDEIAISIADRLEVNIEDDIRLRKARRHTGNLDAYSLYLKGRYFWNMRTGESLKKAIHHFEKAIELDDEYALAYTGLSDAFRALPDYVDCLPDKAYGEAKRTATKAIEIDDSLAEAHTSLAVVLNYIFDWAGSRREFRKALDLNPDYAAAHHWYALYLMYRATFDEAIVEIKKAHSLDPLSLAINRDIGTVFYYSGRYDEAIEALQRTIELDPNFSLVHELLGRIYLEKGMYKEALREFSQEKNFSRSWRPVLDTWIAIAFMKLGRMEKADDLLKDLLERSRSAFISPYSLSCIFFALGDEEQGFHWLEKACQKCDSWLCEIKVEPVFEKVRENQRFVSILSQLGLSE